MWPFRGKKPHDKLDESEKETLFMITDCDGAYNDLGMSHLLKERTSVMTAGDQSSYPQQRCAIFELHGTKFDDGHQINFVVAIVHSNKELKEFAVGEWTDAKVGSGFASRQEAEIAYDNYGPNHLAGHRVAWSQYRRVV